MKHAKPTGQQKPGDDPTPEQIRAQCREIQATWSEGDERYRRTKFIAKPRYTFPIIKIKDVFRA
jgi:hypothetical protein